MEKEWRKIIDVHPRLLYKDDLEELLSIISECNKDEPSRIEIVLSNNDRKIICSSFHELIGDGYS